MGALRLVKPERVFAYHAAIPVLPVARERINDIYRDYDGARALRPWITDRGSW
jgi:hypothetical protein